MYRPKIYLLFCKLISGRYSMNKTSKIPPFFYSAAHVYKQGASGFVMNYLLH
jgi:hypothetical protein